MRVSQRLDYALRALTLLAQQPPATSVAAGDLAERLRLPKRFVEQQLSALARAGVVSCRRGASGGCSLARPAEEISVREVVEAIQGAVLDVPSTSGSASAEFWGMVAAEFAALLGGTTLRDLADRQTALDAESMHMYYI